MRITTSPMRSVIVVLVTASSVLIGPVAHGTGASAGSSTESTTEPDAPAEGPTEQGTIVLPDWFDPNAAVSSAIIQPPDEAAAEDAAGTVEYSMEATETSAAATYWLKCKIKATNPHYSRNAPGVIAKLVVRSCTGNHYGTVSVG